MRGEAETTKPEGKIIEIVTINGTVFKPKYCATQPGGVVLAFEGDPTVIVISSAQIAYVVTVYESAEAVEAMFNPKGGKLQ
jgi:hypothetical protein